MAQQSTSTRRTAVAFVALLAAAMMLAATQLGPEPAGAAAKAAKVKPGKYKGSVFDEGDRPDDKQWVKFKVAAEGRKLKGFTSRLWVVCYAGGTTYLNLPVKFSAPTAEIDRGGRVEHEWTEPFTYDGEQEELHGILELRFKKNRATGKIALEFASCGTTTGDPPGPMLIKARRSR